MTMIFRSCFSQQMESYVHYRIALGYKNISALKSCLKQLDRYLPETDVKKALSPSFLLEFKKSITGSHSTVNNKLSIVRKFYDYLIRTEHAVFNPLQDIPPYKANAFIPFIFSKKETDAVLRAVLYQIRRDETHFLKDMILYTAILLLARCGMRISEPCRLHLSHYRPSELTMYIEETKFSKDRLVAVPKSVANELNHYLAVRKTFFDDDNPFLFPRKAGKSITPRHIYPVFYQAVASVGLNEPARVTGNMRFGAPRPHSLRHSFAVNTLKTIKERGKSPQQALPILSAYMGHSLYKYTAIYLKLTDAEHRRHLVSFNLSLRDKI
jgi:integrase/recombinase XerD